MMIAEQPTITLRTYATVFIALIALLLLTVALAFIPTHHESTRDLLTATGFLIAAIKAILIILYFMHVRISSRVTWMFAAAGFLWLCLLIGGTLNDYFTREEVPGASKLNPQVIEPSAQPLAYRPEGSTGKETKR